ncbi:c-type cytochrome [Oryzomonas japonica]|uniref:C-type cytochrome n=1 Tax=Oryzomonas japonica TaxID=2603858 RepID=A0A7J4ZNV9_9BACT|nr:c-type cytochrome [Oryzomonas japonica]KAB0664434.1 c-type cytochrome [Oryzomonas japonica]
MENTRGWFVAALVMVGAVLLPALSAHCGDTALARGEAAFLRNCVACHADGGNEVNPVKTLSRADLRRNNILTPDDIVRLMRNPGPGMLKFDPATLSDEDARAIAEYILGTFNK